MRLLVFGDSIAQGFYDVEGGWVHKLKVHYNKLSSPDSDNVMVFNLGVSGDTTSSVLSRLEDEVEARRFSKNTRFCLVIAIGINDTLFGSSVNEVSLKQFEANIHELIEHAKEITDKIIFVGFTPIVDSLMQPVPWNDGDENYSMERAEQYNHQLVSTCNSEDITIVDILSQWRDRDYQDLLEDGLHPNAAGHQLIFEQLLPIIEETIGL